MIIDFLNLQKFNTFADFKTYKAKLTKQKSFEIQQKLKKDDAKAKYILKPFEELTDVEKKEMCSLYYKHELSTILVCSAFANKDNRDLINAEQKKYEQKLKNNNFTDEESLAIYNNLAKSYTYTLNYNKSKIDDFSNKIVITIKKSSINTENLQMLKVFAEKMLSNGLNVSICIHDSQENDDFNIDYLYSNDQINQIIDLNDYLLEKGMKDQIRFNESSLVNSDIDLLTTWSLDDVIKANKNINDVVEHIKKNNFSPFEAMTYIHMHVTSNFKYTEGRLEECRSIVGAYQGKIVCAGYSSLVKAIVDKLNDPNLQCECIGADLYKKHFFRYEFEGGHSHNLIHIKDEKYNIDGHYMEDTCWDSKSDDYPTGKGFTYFMYPVTDLEYFNGMIYQQKFSDRLYDSVFFDQEQFAEALIDSKKAFKYQLKIPEIVERYGAKSTPIPLETLRKTIFRVYPNAQALDQSSLENVIDEKLALSVQRAKRGFTSKASGSLVTTKKYRKAQFSHDNKRKPTLAELDGRQ